MIFKKDFESYKMRLTVRAIIYYEQLTGKSFLTFGTPGTTDDDALALLYACFITSNNVTATLSTFKVLYGDEKFQKWINNAFAEAMEFYRQFNVDTIDDSDTDKENNTGADVDKEDVKKATITNIAAYLIATNHMSAEYVMNEMQLFEIKAYMKAIDTAEKQRLIEERLWCYLTIAPHIDTKRIKSPQKLLPFDWEATEIKKRELEDLRAQKENIKRIVGMDMSALFRRPDDDSGPELQSLDIKGSDLAITDEEQHGDD